MGYYTTDTQEWSQLAHLKKEVILGMLCTLFSIWNAVKVTGEVFNLGEGVSVRNEMCEDLCHVKHN